MASSETVKFNKAHSPAENSIKAFNNVLSEIKAEMIKSRRNWDLHEPKMWSRARGVSDKELVTFMIEDDLVEVRSGATSYGTIILGKIRIPAVTDQDGEGFIHVRIHNPPNRGREDVVFHFIFTDEGQRDADGHPTKWRTIQTADVPLKFFSE